VKKLIYKGFLFLTILTLILASLSNVFIYKIDHRGKLLEGLYNSDDPYDVVLMGSSHINGGIDPNVLWKQYGITSFNYATGGQPLDVTYYLLREVLKKHTPAIVVVDLFYLGMETPYGETGFISNYAETDKKTDIPEKGLYYFHRFIELSKEKGFQLVFVNMPCDYTESNQSDGWVNDCEALFNTVSDLCQKENVPFLDLCDRMDEIGLDFAQDMNNSGHLNIWGAYKTSSYFGTYLKQNFNLPDRRSDAELAARWNQDYSHSLAAAVENGTAGT
jgi:hypothetical protein